MIDTGASITCISPKVSERMKLRSLGKEPAGVASGEASLNTYFLDLIIPFGELKEGTKAVNVAIVNVPNLKVMEFLGNNPKYEGLLGRDIIDRGTFVIAGWDRKYYFSI